MPCDQRETASLVHSFARWFVRLVLCQALGWAWPSVVDGTVTVITETGESKGSTRARQSGQEGFLEEVTPGNLIQFGEMLKGVWALGLTRELG